MTIIYKQNVVLLCVSTEGDSEWALAVPFEMSLVPKNNKVKKSASESFLEIIETCISILSSRYREIDSILDLYRIEYQLKNCFIQPRFLYSSLLPICIGLAQLFRSILLNQNSTFIICGSGRVENDGEIVPIEKLHAKLRAFDEYYRTQNAKNNFMIVTHRNFKTIWEILEILSFPFQDEKKFKVFIEDTNNRAYL